MKQLLLTRLESGNHGTFGTIQVENRLFVTGELPWRHNEPFTSCIPKGIYHCFWNFSNRFNKNTFNVWPVKGRSGIRIHSANLMGDRAMGFRSQVDGCIVIGKFTGDIRGQKAVLASKEGLLEFEDLLKRRPFVLEIVGGPDTILK